MSTIDKILWLLKDGKWHDMKEVTEKTALPKDKAEIAVNFLGDYEFIKLNENTKKVKIQHSMLKFIEETQRLEQEDALNH